MSILALDWGQRFVGYASSDPEGMVITPRGFFERKAPQDKTWSLLKNDVAQLKKIFEEWECESIILGSPLGASGKATEASMGAKSLAEEIGTTFKLPVFLVDEYLTSWEANQATKSSKQSQHAESAAIILKNYFRDKL